MEGERLRFHLVLVVLQRPHSALRPSPQGDGWRRSRLLGGGFNRTCGRREEPPIQIGAPSGVGLRRRRASDGISPTDQHKMQPHREAGPHPYPVVPSPRAEGREVPAAGGWGKVGSEEATPYGALAYVDAYGVHR